MEAIQVNTLDPKFKHDVAQQPGGGADPQFVVYVQQGLNVAAADDRGWVEKGLAVSILA